MHRGSAVAAALLAALVGGCSSPSPSTPSIKIGDDSVIYLAENGKAVRVTVQLLRGDGKITQVKSYKKHGATDWTEITGGELVATPAAAVTDGMTIP